MRNSVRVGEHLLAEVKREAIRTGSTLTSIVEDALRERLARHHATDKTRIEWPTFGGRGLRSGVDLDATASLVALMEEELGNAQPEPDAWDPAQYARFQQERHQPFFDLLDLVLPVPHMRIGDLGCGTGELTATLHQRLAARETVGLDRSPAMLAESTAYVAPGLRFEQGDIASFAPDQPFDLLFSNAALQWVPDHPTLFTRLTSALTDQGQLAVQVPANEDHPSHAVAAEIAREEQFASALGGYVRDSAILTPEAYALLLERCGYREQHVRLQVYVHRLESREAVVEWVKGTLLTAYRRRLSDELYAEFLEAYRARLFTRLEDARPFPYAFKRMLLWARR